MSSVGYCVKCKSKREFNNGVEKQTKNGRRMLQGLCNECGTKVNVFMKSNNPKKSKPRTTNRSTKKTSRSSVPKKSKNVRKKKTNVPSESDVDSDTLSKAEMSDYSSYEDESSE